MLVGDVAVILCFRFPYAAVPAIILAGGLEGRELPPDIEIGGP